MASTGDHFDERAYGTLTKEGVIVYDRDAHASSKGASNGEAKRRVTVGSPVSPIAVLSRSSTPPTAGLGRAFAEANAAGTTSPSEVGVGRSSSNEVDDATEVVIGEAVVEELEVDPGCRNHIPVLC